MTPLISFCNSSPLFFWTLNLVTHSVGLQIHACLIDPVFGAELNAKRSTAVHIALSDPFPDRPGHTDHRSDHRACQLLTAYSSRALRTVAGVVGSTGGPVLALGHAGCDHACLTKTSCVATGTAASVEAHTHSAILTGLLAAHRLYLAASSLPPSDT